ncbi:MAG: hypothetical protein ACLQCB_01955 [Spirochaetia bacterium]
MRVYRPCAERSLSTAARVALVALCALLLASCGLRQSRIRAEQGVKEFHALLNKEQYDAIYDKGGDALKKAWTRSDFKVYLADIHSQLGMARKAVSRGFQASESTGQGTEVGLEMETTFDHGIADERFLWRLEGDTPVLLDYRADVEPAAGPTTV